MINLALLIPRVIIGLLFVGHGTQKLFGWFGGKGLTATAAFLDRTGIRPARAWALAVGLFETVGGLLLTFGLATPVAAALIAAVMLGAVAFVHLEKGIWVANGGGEYPVVLLAASALYGLAGAGSYSLDAYLGASWPIPTLYLTGFIASLLIVVALRLLAWRLPIARHGTATAA